MKFYLPTIAILSVCISCSNNKPADSYVPLKDVLTNSSSAAAGSQNAGGNSSGNNAPATQGSSAKVNPAHGQPGHRCDLPEGAALPDAPAQQAQTPPPAQASTPVPASAPTEVKITPPAPAGKSSAGLNPEHGKPGHRCDIAVGAPLNSKPAATTQPQTLSATPAKTVTAPGMNPRHGEPGHRCDIAVGSPLKQDNAAQPAKLIEKDSAKGK